MRHLLHNQFLYISTVLYKNLMLDKFQLARMYMYMCVCVLICDTTMAQSLVHANRSL